MKYDLKKMIEEIHEDEKVFQRGKNYLASQEDIKQLAQRIRAERQNAGAEK